MQMAIAPHLRHQAEIAREPMWWPGAGRCEGARGTIHQRSGPIAAGDSRKTI